MASWGRVYNILRSFARTPRVLAAAGPSRTVGTAVVASLVGAGLIHQRYGASRTFPVVVYAEEPQVNLEPVLPDWARFPPPNLATLLGDSRISKK